MRRMGERQASCALGGFDEHAGGRSLGAQSGRRARCRGSARCWRRTARPAFRRRWRPTLSARLRPAFRSVARRLAAAVPRGDGGCLRGLADGCGARFDGAARILRTPGGVWPPPQAVACRAQCQMALLAHSIRESMAGLEGTSVKLTHLPGVSRRALAPARVASAMGLPTSSRPSRSPNGPAAHRGASFTVPRAGTAPLVVPGAKRTSRVASAARQRLDSLRAVPRLAGTRC